MAWSIVRTDNFGQSGEVPGRDEKIVATGFLTKEAAILEASKLNDKFGGEDSYDYFMVVDGGYKPAVFEP